MSYPSEWIDESNEALGIPDYYYDDMNVGMGHGDPYIEWNEANDHNNEGDTE